MASGFLAQAYSCGDMCLFQVLREHIQAFVQESQCHYHSPEYLPLHNNLHILYGRSILRHFIDLTNCSIEALITVRYIS